MFDHCLYFNTSALARRLDREWTEAFARFGLTPPQGFMLRAILDQPGMAQRQLADAMAISRATATRALDGLEQLGLIERRRAGEDGREIAVVPTRQGSRLKAGLNKASGDVTSRLKQRFGDTQFVDLVGKIRDVRSALD